MTLLDHESGLEYGTAFTQETTVHGEQVKASQVLALGEILFWLGAPRLRVVNKAAGLQKRRARGTVNPVS